MEVLMAKVTFILGLCGSGKTYLSEQLKKQTGADVFENLFEDGSNLSALIQRLKEGKDCIIDEVRLCLSTYRDAIMQHLSQIAGLETYWICYENDLESANWNVMHRKNKGDPEGHLEINLRLHPHYDHPANAAIIPIQRI
jgi:hypothetical protein